MMKHITYFKQMMEDFQELNLQEKGISFAEEGFTQLYEQSIAAIQLQEDYIKGFVDGAIDGTMDAYMEHYNNGVKKATVKGIIIGGVTTGVGVGLMKLRKNRKDKEQKLRRDNLQGED